MKRALFLLCLCPLLGCGASNAEQSYPVSGTVMLNKKPLAEGQVTLEDATGSVPATMTIVDGKFEGKARAGSHKVAIRSFRVSEKAVKSGPGVKDERPRENIIPERYNTKSTLKREVKAEGVNEFPFDLQTP